MDLVQRPMTRWFSAAACVYAVLSPFYLFRSGLPQLADALFALTIFIGLCVERFRSLLAPVLPNVLLYLFVAYVILNQSVWVMLIGKWGGLMPILYYVFNAATCVVCARAFQDRRSIHWVKIAFAISICLQVVLSVIAKPTLGTDALYVRQVIYFNNPNQLAYWTLLSCAFLLLARTEGAGSTGRGEWAMHAIAMGGGLWLMALALSKAGLVGFALLLLLYLVDRIKRHGFGGIGLLALGIAGFVAVGSVTFEKIQLRLATLGQDHDDTLAARGYDRVVDYPEYLLLGAGEGAEWRFNADFEIHSSLGNILFSYGVPGLLLFVSFIIGRVWASARPGWSALSLTPLFLYGLTHMGLREGLFWVVVAALTLPKAMPSLRVERVSP